MEAQKIPYGMCLEINPLSQRISPAVGNSKDPDLHKMLGSFIIVSISVADPVRRIHMFFGPPGSGTISQRYGSGSFYHQAKVVRKT